MSTERINVLACVLFLLTVSTACEKRLDYEGDELKTVVVLNSFVGDTDETKFRVTKSKSVLDAGFQFEALENCSIRLRENGVLVAESSTFNGVEYAVNTQILSGRTYQVEIDHPSLDNVQAETYVPNTVSELSAIAEDFGDYVDIRVQFDDLIDADFYQLIVLDSDDPFSIPLGWSTNSQYFDLDVLEGDDRLYLDQNAWFSDEAFENGQAEIVLRINEFIGYNPNTLDVQIRSCSEDYFLYFKSREAFQNSDGGLFVQPVQIHSNIDNGLGVFAGYNSVTVPVEF